MIRFLVCNGAVAWSAISAQSDASRLNKPTHTARFSERLLALAPSSDGATAVFSVVDADSATTSALLEVTSCRDCWMKNKRTRLQPRSPEEENDLIRAIRGIKCSETFLNYAFKLYGIPKSTVSNKLNKKVPMEKKIGPLPKRKKTKWSYGFWAKQSWDFLCQEKT
nr:unnamed protein product [Callosobruchus analis]